jgi:hypothetical protein
MPDSGVLAPISDEQAKAIQEVAKAAQEALKALQGVGGFLKDVVGTTPEDIVGYLGGDWLKVRRAENLARIIEKAQERLRARGAEASKHQASLSLALPILVAAADESRDELQDLWARLLAAAADPTRTKFFRLAFIEAAKRMDPLDATVLRSANQIGGGNIDGAARNTLAAELKVSRDEIDVSVANLDRLELTAPTHRPASVITPFGREFLRAVRD